MNKKVIMISIIIFLLIIPYVHSLDENPKNVDLFYPEIWYRDSDVKLTMKVYNTQNQLYEPPTIQLNFTIDGVELDKSKVNELSQIINTFEVSEDAELGKHTMEITIIDERTIKQTIEFTITEEDKEKDESYNKMLIKIIIATVILIFLFVVILLILDDERRRKQN